MFSLSLLNLALLQLRAMPKSQAGFYAVKHGVVPGIYRSWSECEKQVKGFRKPAFKKFSSLQEAQEFIGDTDKSGQDISSVELNTLSHDNISTTTHAWKQNTTSTNDLATRITGNHVTSITDDSSQESLTSSVSQMQSTISRMFNMIEALSSDVCRLQGSVAALEGAVFAAPGTLKRDFHTMSADYQKASESKRAKTDGSSKNPITGPEFEDKDGVHVYTDGGCFGNGKLDSKAGIGVFWDHNDSDNVSERLSGRQSNNRAEIFAAVKAVQIAKRKGITNLVLHTDSQFLINGITKWIKGWKRNGWKLSTGHPVINKDDFTALDNELSGISVKWVYVKGHSGDPGNEEADRLAKQGARM